MSSTIHALLSFMLTAGITLAAFASAEHPEAQPTEQPVEQTEEQQQEVFLPPTQCGTQFLGQAASVSGNAVCARTVDEAQGSALRVGQAVIRHIGLDFENFAVRSERRCDCEFAYGRYDMTPRDKWNDRLGWLRTVCAKFYSKDGKTCGKNWFQSDEGFKPQVCDPANNPAHQDCIPGSFVSELRDPATNTRKLIPVTVCARQDGTLNANGTPTKDVLVMVVDAQSIKTYANYINGCINITIKKDPQTKKIAFTANAPAHSLEEVRSQEMLRGSLFRKAE